MYYNLIQNYFSSTVGVIIYDYPHTSCVQYIMIYIKQNTKYKIIVMLIMILYTIFIIKIKILYYLGMSVKKSKTTSSPRNNVVQYEVYQVRVANIISII